VDGEGYDFESRCDPDAAVLGDLGALKAGATRECEEHGWMIDPGDPHAWECALAARQDSPARRFSRRHGRSRESRRIRAMFCFSRA